MRDTNMYRFNEKKHLHEILIEDKWKSLTGCTTVLNVLAKPALIQWAANMTANFLKENWKADKKYSSIEISGLLEEARKAHCKKRDKAGDYGTRIHKQVEDYIKEKMAGGDPKSDEIKSFVEWSEKNKVKFLESEKHIYSLEHFLGGIVDFVCEIDGEVWMGDIKTSKSGIYPENFAQLAGYQIMLQEMGLYPEIKGYVVLNLKESGEFLEKRNISNSNNKKFFLACLTIYRELEKLKKTT